MAGSQHVQHNPMSVQWFSSQLLGGRTEQQDSSIVLVGSNSQSALAVVADGAGGHQGGREASQKVVEIARGIFRRSGGRLEKPLAELEGLCHQAHDAINALGSTPKNAPRSTVVALYLTMEKAFWMHVGDSRIYRSHQGRLVDRTKDHTMAQILLEQGDIQDREVGSHPDRVKLLKALGGEDRARPSLGSASIDQDDRFLLCTDGFWERLTHREIERFMRGRLSSKALDKIVEKAANRNGSRGDNVTACVLATAQSVESGSAGRGLLVVGLTALASALLADRTLKTLSKMTSQ